MRKGVRQGCTLSPLLFNIYTEFLMRKVVVKWNGGIKVGGAEIDILRYANVTVLISKTSEKMKELKNIVKKDTESLE